MLYGCLHEFRESAYVGIGIVAVVMLEMKEDHQQQRIYQNGETLLLVPEKENSNPEKRRKLKIEFI